MKRIDLTGQRFGRLTVIEYDCTDHNNDARWLCQCGCDKKTPANFAADFARRHGCSVCADKKDCDMTSCKYEKELIS
nr:MAG TPA: hypothetical protein [Caudoviricetes sp.]